MTKANRIVSISRTMPVQADRIFELLADPTQHRVFDGSGTIVAARAAGPERLTLGARFGMQMRLGIPYRITNEVVEFDEGRRIAWRHFGNHVWRYELEPTEEGTTVTESFDWANARFPPFYEWVGYPDRHRANITASLEQLEAHLVQGPAS